MQLIASGVRVTVCFSEVAAAFKALNGCPCQDLGGRTLHIHYSVPQPEKSWRFRESTWRMTLSLLIRSRTSLKQWMQGLGEVFQREECNIMVTSFYMKCAYDQQGQLLASPIKTYGILGLSSATVTLPSQLASQGIINNVIGHFITDEANGGVYMFLGDDFVPRWGMTWIPTVHGITYIWSWQIAGLLILTLGSYWELGIWCLEGGLT